MGPKFEHKKSVVEVESDVGSGEVDPKSNNAGGNAKSTNPILTNNLRQTEIQWIVSNWTTNLGETRLNLYLVVSFSLLGFSLEIVNSQLFYSSFDLICVMV